MEVDKWTLSILDSENEKVHSFGGSGSPPAMIKWDGKVNDESILKGGEIYQYQMEIVYNNKTTSMSAKRLFGVNRTSAISLNLSGGAFGLGSFKLNSKAVAALKETADILRKYPEEKIIIEGHSDSLGTRKVNLRLSQSRAEAARDYLVKEEKLPKRRFIVRWFGEKKPMASNDSEVGREHK